MNEKKTEFCVSIVYESDNNQSLSYQINEARYLMVPMKGIVKEIHVDTEWCEGRTRMEFKGELT